MRLAKSIMLKSGRRCFRITFFSILFISSVLVSEAQDNSPYSRYGLGNLFPQSNVSTRGMGGVTAGYADVISVNFANPASYSQFQAIKEQRSNKLQSGRVVLDVGVDFANRTLVQPNTPNKFTSSNALFSYLQVGLPLKKNWGLSFGLRPLTRISYKINRTELLNDPITGLPIDTASTQFEGSGGSYLPTIGTGFAIGNFSVGANLGYLFGSKDISTRRNIINSLDTLAYHPSDHTTNTSFGNLYFDAGVQYKIAFDKKNNKMDKSLTLGASGNVRQKISATQDILRQTYFSGTSGEELRLDSVYEQSGVKGEIIYPASYRVGFLYKHLDMQNYHGYMIGVDFSQSKWSQYRFFGEQDSVRDSWQINVGGQITPKSGINYFSRVAYRFGFYTGIDYVKVQDNLPVIGGSLGMALPIGNHNRMSPGQFSVVNLSLEYAKRGNNSSPLKENIFRISLGFNLTDLWFGKRKYE